MAKVKVMELQRGGRGVWFMCPGCKSGHMFFIDQQTPPSWTFNGNPDRPTCEPSLLYPDANPRCHLFLRDGKVQFLADCGHELAGQIIELPDLTPDD